MSGFVEFLGVEAGTETEGDTGAELDVVGEGCKTLIVDLGLDKFVSTEHQHENFE